MDESSPDADDEDEIDDRPDRIVDLLATYLP